MGIMSNNLIRISEAPRDHVSLGNGDQIGITLLYGTVTRYMPQRISQENNMHNYVLGKNMMFLIIETFFFITLPYVSLYNRNFVYNEESCQPHLCIPNKKLFQF